MNTINVENCKTLLIGRRGENEVTTVLFDFTEWASEFGSGVVDLYVKRFGDNSAYPVLLTIDGTVASWLVTETDTNVAGYGKAEYVYRVDGKIAKSAVFPFFVAEDIGQPASEPPDPYESWLEQLTALGAETEAHAQAAEQSAENAAESAEDAAQSATSAEGYAGQAETAAGLAQAAQTASEAARDAAQTAQASAESSATAASGSAASAASSATAAAGSASDASSSASAAGASATAASASATTASNAATAAQTAQSAAEDAAEDAQQAAQQAHVEYEQLSGEVDDLSDEVSQQKSAIEDLQDLVDRKAGMLVDTASGAIASFVPDSTIPNLLGVTVDVEPVQDLHGYDNPWPAGGGKNLFDIDGWLTATGTTYTKSGNIYTITAATPLFTQPFQFSDTDIEVTISYTDFTDVTAVNTTIDVLNANGGYVRSLYKSSSPTVVTGSKLRFNWSTAGQFTIANIQVEKGSTQTSWTPYSNLCPISGWDSVEVDAAGINIFDDAALVDLGGVKQEDGSVYFAHGGLILNKTIWSNPSGYAGQLAITLKRKSTGAYSTGRLVVLYTDGTQDRIGLSTDVSNEFNTYTLITPSTKSVVSITGTYGTNREFYWKIQIELGNTLTTYKPYAGNRYTIAIGQTVYGGTLDATAGTLTVNRASVRVADSSITNGTTSVDGTNRYNISVAGIKRAANASVLGNLICSSYPNVTALATYRVTLGASVSHNSDSIYIYDPEFATATVKEFKTAKGDVQLVYELATPIEIPLDPVTISTISGQTNNVWADAGDVSVEFAADLKHYIDSKIAAAVAALS